MPNRFTRRTAIAGLALGGVLPSLLADADPWTSADLLTVKELADRLKAGSAKPLILHVGFPVLYRGAHIPGSLFAGPGSKPEGIEMLRNAVAQVPHAREIVIYCGCCPWQQCPNMRPAFRNLREAGFTNVKALMIATNIHTDWVEKGYSIEKGE